MNPYFYSLEMAVRQWTEGARENACHWVEPVLEGIAEENNL